MTANSSPPLTPRRRSPMTSGLNTRSAMSGQPSPAPALRHCMTRQLLTLIALLLPLSALLSCSQVTQVEDDCTVTQYFDDEFEFCRNCPPVTAPMCEAGCGYQFTTDNHGCQVAECDCGFCAEGSYFDADVYACVDCPLVESPECQQGCPAAGKAVDRSGCACARSRARRSPHRRAGTRGVARWPRTSGRTAA